MKLRITKIEASGNYGTTLVVAESPEGLLPFAHIEIEDGGLERGRCVGDEIEVKFGDLDRTERPA